MGYATSGGLCIPLQRRVSVEANLRRSRRADRSAGSVPNVRGGGVGGRAKVTAGTKFSKTGSPTSVISVTVELSIETQESVEFSSWSSINRAVFFLPTPRWESNGHQLCVIA